MLLLLYRFFSLLASPIILLFILYRLFTGKEQLSRFGERLGIASAVKDKEKNLIWLHGASVGESITALSLIKKLALLYPSYQFLLTSSTVTAAQLIANKKPAGIIHQYIPLDLKPFVKRFINYWQPKVAILIDSEIWPNLVSISSKSCPIILANAIISERSTKTWSFFKPLHRQIFEKFSLILAQDQNNCDKFIKLGAKNVLNAGALKFSNEKPIYQEEARALLASQIIGRRVLLAASTHPGDEQYLAQCYVSLKAKYPNLLLIIAPRHPHRAQEIRQTIQQAKLTHARRSNNDLLSDNIDVYIADTLGELGLFYSLAEISFIGGSLKNGGHNVIEPSFFNTVILFGPDMKNFASIAEEYIKAKAAIMCREAAHTTQIIDELLSNPTKQNSHHLAAAKLLAAKASIIELYLNKISETITNA